MGTLDGGLWSFIQETKGPAVLLSDYKVPNKNPKEKWKETELNGVAVLQNSWRVYLEVSQFHTEKEQLKMTT